MASRKRLSRRLGAEPQPGETRMRFAELDPDENDDEDWGACEPDSTGDGSWEPDPFDDDQDEEEPEPEHGDFWPEPEEPED